MSAGLYVHFPFCPYLCNYCDYFKVLHLSGLEEKFFKALTTETKLVAREIGKSKTIETIFIGGGTPSIANLNLLRDWMQVARESFEFTEEPEFSIECNVDTVDVDILSAYKELGVTRPSFGMQSFNETLLKILTRPHSPRTGHKVVYHANVLGFKSFNIDMLFGIPEQTTKTFSADINQLTDMEPPHVSLYELSIESETELAESIDSGELTLPDEPTTAAMFCSAAATMTENGYEHYEICSFAKSNCECKHNLNYWQGGEYIGLGPSANSYLNGKSYINVASVGDYIKSLTDKKLPRTVEQSSLLKRADETIRSSLRLKRGIDRDLFLQRFGIPVEERIKKNELETLIKSEMLVENGRMLLTTEQGFYKADEIARKLLK